MKVTFFMHYKNQPFKYLPHYITVIGTDTETGGLDPIKNGIIELGAIGQTYLGEELGRFYSLVNPGEHKIYEHEALLINKITMEEIIQAPHIKDVLPEYVAALRSWFKEKTWSNNYGKNGTVPETHVVGHNLDFDLRMIRQALMDWCPTLLPEFNNIVRHKFDTQDHSSVYGQQRTLKGLCEYFGVINANSHTVMGDIIATLDCYHILRGRERLQEHLLREHLKLEAMLV